MVEYKDVLGFEQEPLESADFASLKEAVEEARRCLNCAVPQCRKGCPINNEIPQFIHALAQATSAKLPNTSRTTAVCPASAAASARGKSSVKGPAYWAKRENTLKSASWNAL